MTDPGQTPQPGAPAPGWYHDAQGQLRWWDGAGWTEHTKVEEAAPEVAPPEPPMPAVSTEPTPLAADVPSPTPAPDAIPATPGAMPPAPDLATDTAPPTPIPAPPAPAPATPWQESTPTEPVLSPTMPDLTPPSTVGTGFGEKSFLPWIIALVAAVAMIVIALVVLSSATDDDSTGDGAPTQEVQDAQAGLRTAQTTIETFALDNNGSYSGATAEGLVALEGTLGDLEGLTVSGQSTGYTLSATAGDVTFTITRSGDGVVVFSCTPPGGSGCDQTGTWGVAA